ncbi:polyprenyl synthetase family protein [bacterium]|nr:polyprenyl synthetase family protein [bacterium]
MQLAEFRASYTPLIQAELARQLAAVATPELRAAMGHLLGRGKFFRPLLVLATCRALSGADPAAYVPVAAPLETIHTFTLIHDDLPALDDAQLRRGVPTVHLAHGEPQAVLAGDGLLSLAISWLADGGLGLAAEVQRGIIQTVVNAIRVVVEGEIIDMYAEGGELDLAALKDMYRCKTGALLGACCAIGGWLTGAGPADRAALAEIGTLLGLAFQIRDDLLSHESTDSITGKTLATDEQHEKSTYPRLLGLDGARSELEATLTQVEQALGALGLREPQLLLEIAAWAGRRSN